MHYLALGCRAALAVTFLLAVAGKLAGQRAFAEFTRSVRDMHAVPARFIEAAARATVVGEAATVLLVVLPVRPLAAIGCAFAVLLTLLFSSAIARSLRTGRRTPCRCFGRSTVPLGGRHLIRNAVLLIVGVAGLATTVTGGPTQLTGTAVAVLAGSFLGLIIATFDDIATLLAPAAR